ncbi:hypothetical protein D3C80_1979550 [compost metagenome]
MSLKVMLLMALATSSTAVTGPATATVGASLTPTKCRTVLAEPVWMPPLPLLPESLTTMARLASRVAFAAPV